MEASAALPRSPFRASASRAGHGSIISALLPPQTTVMKEVSFQYPLKLISPGPINVKTPDQAGLIKLVHTIFLLTYGGGLVAGDKIDLKVDLAAGTRLCLLTQGSTKIYKTSDATDVVCKQGLRVKLADTAVLCYLPDPVQPFEGSAFEQRQTYVFSGNRHANVCVCDWVCEGRSARKEQWSFRRYVSRNEFWRESANAEGRLLLRDNAILHKDPTGVIEMSDRVHSAAIIGTLIICGSLFDALGTFFLDEFRRLPRVGAKQWESGAATAESTSNEGLRAARIDQETHDGVLWTAAASRGFVIVKFSARTVEGGKSWLRYMLHTEGSVERELGERSIMCLR